MKTSGLLLAPVLGLTLLLSPARAEDAPATNVQEVQNIITQLSKLAAEAAGKRQDAPDFGKVLGELTKMVATATPATTKEEQAQESQLIAFVKSLLALVPQVPEEAADVPVPVDPDAGPVQVDSRADAAAAPKDHRIQGSSVQGSSAISTGGLTTGSLNGGPSRTTDAEWRTRFPVRPAPVTK